MPREKLSSNFREANVILHLSRDGYNIISEQFKVQCSAVRKIIHNWKAFKLQSTICLEDLPRESLSYKKKKKEKGSMTQTCTNEPKQTTNTSGTMSYEKWRPKWSCLASVPSTKFNKKHRQHFSTETSSVLLNSVVSKVHKCSKNGTIFIR